MGWLPPAGSAVDLGLGGAYTPPPGSAVPLPFGTRQLRSVGLSWLIWAQPREQALSWELEALETVQRSQGLAWQIGGGGEQGLSWGLHRGGEQALSWRAFRGGAQGLVWDVVHLPDIAPGLYRDVSALHGSAGQKRRLLRDGFSDPPRRRALAALGWDATRRERAEVAESWRQALQERAERGFAWEAPADRLRQLFAVPFRTPPKIRAERLLPWGQAEQFASEGAVAFRYPPRRQAQPAAAWEPGRRLRLETAEPFAFPARLRPHWRLPWGRTHLVEWLERWKKELRQRLFWRQEGLDPAESYTPDPGSAVRLRLDCPLLDWPGYSAWLFLRKFPCPASSNAQKRRAWFLMNSLSVVRLPDRTPVPALEASLSTDFDSWAWGLSLTLPDRDALSLVNPASGPAEVEVTINGHVWTALVESFQERRQFGKSGFTVSGRSRSAALAAPYAAARSYEEAEVLQAQALAAAEITGSGWALAWEALDWLVPPGAFAYAQKTPMEALAQIAAAIGARIQSDPKNDLLRVLSRYPIPPWSWAATTPDKILSDNLVTSLGLRWEERPSWNGVYVSGASQGVLVQVKRTGSDGTPCAPMIVDPLITTVAAGRERGLVELASGGKQASVTLELPLLPSPDEPGLLLPGQLVEVDDGVELWRGLVTSVSVQAGRPTVRQSVELERHYE